MHNKYNLSDRINDFKNIIENTVYTNANNETINIEAGIQYVTNFLKMKHEQGAAIYLIGNGGSAAVASHAATDLVNACHLRAFTLHESALVTCMANDFGYDGAFKFSLQAILRENDVLIAISGSGRSPSIHQAVDYVKDNGGSTITLTGFKSDNSLRAKGHANFWVDSHDYALVELSHHFLLHNVTDHISANVVREKKMEYFS